MELVERSYAGKYFRPKPRVILSHDPLRLVVATPWGDRDETDYVLNLFEEQLNVEEPLELTSPIARISSLSPRANQLRAAAITANDYLFREVNRNEYQGAVEFVGLTLEEGILSWVQIGSPQILIRQRNQTQPLAYQMDWSWQYRQESPLFSQALGIESSCYLNCGSMTIESGTDLFLLSRHSISPPIFSDVQLDLVRLTKHLIAESSEAPFWLGHLIL